MIEILKKSILNEAASLMQGYTQVKEKNNSENKGISFVDMLLTKDESKNDEVFNVEIKIEDKNDPISEKRSSKDELNKEAISDKKDELKNSKSISKDKKKSTLEDDDKNLVRINHNKENKNETVKVTVKFNDPAFNTGLDFSSKEKIKSIIKDLKAGKISEVKAEALINQVINTSNIASLTKNMKDKNIKVEISNSKKSEAASLDNSKKSLFVPVKDVNKKEEKIEFLNTGEKKESINNEKNALKNPVKNQNKFKLKDEENNSIEIRNDSKTEKFDIKQFSIELNREKFSEEPKKILENNKESFFSQIAKNTKIALSENFTKFSTMIRPENFGRIDFNMTVKDGKVNGRIILQNQEAADFFKANVEELRAVFQKSNVDMENLEIILAGNRFGENAQNSSSGNYSENKAEQVDNKIFVKKNISEFEDTARINSNNYSKQDYSKINIMA